jgi:signal transduction histidine kinase
MSAQAQAVLIAAACTGTAGATGATALRALRGASLRLQLHAAAAVAILAVAAGTLGTASAMLITPHSLDIAGIAYAETALAAFGLSWLAGRQTRAGSQALRQAAGTPGQDEASFRAPAGPMAAGLSALSREFDATVLRLRESRERERRMERSRRQLIAWAIRDLLTPLAGLQAMTEAPDDGIAADASRHHRQIRAEVTRLSAITDDLLQLFAIETETLSLSPGGTEIIRPPSPSTRPGHFVPDPQDPPPRVSSIEPPFNERAAGGVRVADHVLTPDREAGRLLAAAEDIG